VSQSADYDALRLLAEDCLDRNDGPLPPDLARLVLDLLTRVKCLDRGVGMY
jgi:hypothetical protein